VNFGQNDGVSHHFQNLVASKNKNTAPINARNPLESARVCLTASQEAFQRLNPSCLHESFTFAQVAACRQSEIAPGSPS
jgi:hypothetical protein